MPRVFRQQYTRPIPADAQRVTIKNKKGEDIPAVRFKGSDGKTITAPITTKGKNAGKLCRVKSPTWYGKVNGVPTPLCTNKAAAEQMLAQLVGEVEHAKALGLPKQILDARKKPLAEHLADFRKALEAKGNAPRYVDLVYSRLKDLLDGCQFVLLADLSASRVMEWLADLRRPDRGGADLAPGKEWFTLKEVAALLKIKPESIAPVIRRHRLRAEGNGKARRFHRSTVETLLDRQGTGASVATTNQYLTHLKVFLNWMKEDKRIGENPFAHLKPGNEEVDRRHDRRELDAEELRRLLTVARDSQRVFRGLTGRDRYHLYATACGTGFRAGGLASLTPESFELDTDMPIVTLAARSNKSRKKKEQPLPPDVAELLRDYLKDKPAGQPIWPGTWASLRVAADMLRMDLEAAGIPYVIDGPDGPLHADFHALRHSYLTLGGRAGIDLRTLQELAGHSDPKLTMRYSHRRLYDLAGAVDKLPNFLPQDQPAEALKATGTDNASPEPLHGAYTPLTRPFDGKGGRTMAHDGNNPDEKGYAAGPKPLQLQGLEAGKGEAMAGDGKAGDGIRTHDVQLGNAARAAASAETARTCDEEVMGLHSAYTKPADPDLARLVEAWPTLPAHIKAAVLALLQTAR